MKLSRDELVGNIEASKRKEYSALGDVLELTKARLSLMVVFTTAIGYIVGSSKDWSWINLIYAVVGTACSAASAAALNQWFEVDVDALMDRTKERPLPAGRMGSAKALWYGIILGIIGVGGLWVLATPLAAVLAFATIVIYLALYTPLKRRSAWCTIVGAVSGAIPPVIGWAAAGGDTAFKTGNGWVAYVVFGLLFFWQIPHFLAIAWMYREEYASAGFVMLKPGDDTGRATALESFIFSLLLFVVSYVPFWFGKMHSLYGVGAAIFNIMYSGSALVFLLDRSHVVARRLFFASIVYLPGILLLLAFLKKN